MLSTTTVPLWSFSALQRARPAPKSIDKSIDRGGLGPPLESPRIIGFDIVKRLESIDNVKRIEIDWQIDESIDNVKRIIRSTSENTPGNRLTKSIDIAKMAIDLVKSFEIDWFLLNE